MSKDYINPYQSPTTPSDRVQIIDAELAPSREVGQKFLKYAAPLVFHVSEMNRIDCHPMFLDDDTSRHSINFTIYKSEGENAETQFKRHVSTSPQIADMGEVVHVEHHSVNLHLPQLQPSALQPGDLRDLEKFQAQIKDDLALIESLIDISEQDRSHTRDPYLIKDRVERISSGVNSLIAAARGEQVIEQGGMSVFGHEIGGDAFLAYYCEGLGAQGRLLGKQDQEKLDAASKRITAAYEEHQSVINRVKHYAYFKLAEHGLALQNAQEAKPSMWRRAKNLATSLGSMFKASAKDRVSDQQQERQPGQ